jgi:putative DNA primase/helicase
MSDYNLTGLNISAEEFLGALFEAGDTVCIRIFSDKKGSAFNGLSLEAKQGHFHAMVDDLKKHNEQNRGIFYAVNFGGNEDSKITRINAQFMECDNLSLERQLVKIKEFPLEPSLIVKTRNFLHCYWLIKDGKVADFRRIQRGLITHFDADTKCVNESRVFRIPGFRYILPLIYCIYHERPILWYQW